jgi:hypothetical protein
MMQSTVNFFGIESNGSGDAESTVNHKAMCS